MRKFIGRLFIPVVAAAMLVFAVIHVVGAQQVPPKPPPPVEPSRTPFGKTVAGAGIVEPANEASGTSAVSVGSQQAGVVVARQQIGQTAYDGRPGVGAHPAQERPQERGEHGVSARPDPVAHCRPQHRPGLGVRRRRGKEIEQLGQGFGVTASGAAEAIEPMDLAEMGLVHGGGRRCAALRADEQHLGRERRGETWRIVLIAVWHDRGRGERAARLYGEEYSAPSAWAIEVWTGRRGIHAAGARLGAALGDS